jgi:hypothetical protein
MGMPTLIPAFSKNLTIVSGRLEIKWGREKEF